MKLDYRLHPYRDDLAAEELRGRISAARFVKAREYHVVAGVADLRRHPRKDAILDSQLLLGEGFRVYEIAKDWAWGQALLDDYVGYVPVADLRKGSHTATHRIRVLRTFFYRDADLKSPVLQSAGMNAKVKGEGKEGSFIRVHGGMYVFEKHLLGIGEKRGDYVAMAESLIGVPYRWGGREAMGLDCSALVQLALEWSGIPCPRDSDMQEANLGKEVTDFRDTGLRRGDFVFWRGHVGIMRNESELLHAEANTMRVTVELLEKAEARIAEAEGAIHCVRRIEGTDK